MTGCVGGRSVIGGLVTSSFAEVGDWLCLGMPAQNSGLLRLPGPPRPERQWARMVEQGRVPGWRDKDRWFSPLPGPVKALTRLAPTPASSIIT